MKAVLTLLGLTFAFNAYASKPTLPTQQIEYACDVRLFANDLPGGMAEDSFVAPLQGGNHGGEPRVFNFGEHQVHVLVDGKWRNLTWFYKEKLVTAMVSAGENVVSGHQAIITYNPANTDEELHLSCGVQTKK